MAGATNGVPSSCAKPVYVQPGIAHNTLLSLFHKTKTQLVNPLKQPTGLITHSQTLTFGFGTMGIDEKSESFFCSLESIGYPVKISACQSFGIFYTPSMPLHRLWSPNLFG